MLTAQQFIVQSIMDYKPILPERNSNVSHNHPVKEFIILASGVAGFLLVCFWILGFFVDIAVNNLSPEQESLLFPKVDLKIGQEADVEPKKREAVQAIVDSLRACIDMNYPVQVTIIESEKLNAFAFPGGYIIVFSGILDKMESENGLSFILAHELAHFKNRDHLRSLGRGVVLAGLSTMLTGADSGISRLLAPTGHLGQAQFSQRRETKADMAALEALNCRYGHVGGADEFFEVIQKNGQEVKAGALHYFASHPELWKRIETIRKTAKEKGFHFEEVKELSL